MCYKKIFPFCAALFLSLFVAGCINPTARYGMVKNPDTGLQFGSVVQKNFVTDSSFYKNKKIKIRIRNTSGDTEFNLSEFSQALKQSYTAKGYIPTENSDFGLLIDVNVMYSGQIQTNMANEYSFLGAAGGGLTGASGSALGAAAGVLGGATLGYIVGSYVTDDTYIIISEVSVTTVKERKSAQKSITFSRSPKTKHDHYDQDTKTYRRSIKKVFRNKVSVFAGGRSVRQSRIAREVRERIARIVGDII
jgi:hypothetical protein